MSKNQAYAEKYAEAAMEMCIRDSSIISYAAQIYGFYHEIDRLIDNMGGFTKQLEAHPSNCLLYTSCTLRRKFLL